MKIRIDRGIVVIIYVLSYLLAVAKLRYVLSLQVNWQRLYIICTLFITLLSLFLLFTETGFRKISKLTAVLLMFALYEVLVSFVNKMVFIQEIIIDVLPWPILFAAFYEYCSKKSLPRVFHKITKIGFAICFVLSVPNVQEHLIDWGRHGATIFPVYFLIGYLALIMLNGRKQQIYVCMALVLALLTVSMKRAGILAILGGGIAFFISDAHLKSSLKEKLKKYSFYAVVSIIVIIIGIYFINKYNISILERFRNLSDDQGSGRIGIWKNVWNNFQSSSTLKKIFGHGFHAVYYKVHPIDQDYYSFAHNSYLETLYDYGLIGLLFLIFILCNIITKGIRMMRRKDAYATIWAYTIPPMLFLTLLSYFFEQTLIIVPFIIVWGILFGSMRREVLGTKQVSMDIGNKI